MITEIEQDIFTTDPNEFAIAHQANCLCTMGSGIARLIADRYPEAVKADYETGRNNREKFGDFSMAKCADGRVIFNVYSQFEFGGERPTNYEAVYTGLCGVRDAIAKRNEIAKEKGKAPLNLAIPYGYGSVRGGGSWRIIEMMIMVIFDNEAFNVHICRVPGQARLS